MRRLVVIGVSTLGFLVFVLIAFLTLPFFSSIRANLITSILEDTFENETISIEDVWLRLDRSPAVVLVNVRTSSRSGAQEGLMKADFVDLSFAIDRLFQGRIDLETILVRGFHLNLHVNSEGISNWRTRRQQAPRPIEREFPLLSAVLSERNVDFVDSGVRVNHAPSGFSFMFELDKFTSRQTRRETQTELSGQGRVNGEPFVIESKFPDGLNFEIRSVLGETQLTLLAVANDAQGRTGLTGDLDVQIGSIEEFLRVLRLTPAIDGELSASAKITRDPRRLGLSDIELTATSGHHEVSMIGEIANLVNWSGSDFKLTYVNTDQQSMLPGVPENLADVRVLDASAEIVSVGSELLVHDLFVQSNLANPVFNRFGPINVERAFRTSEGEFRIEGIEVVAGPEPTPTLKITGEIGNLISMSGIEASGDLNMKFAEMLDSPTRGNPEFGDMVGSFQLNNHDGPLNLLSLTVATDNTDLWNLKANLRSRDLLDPDRLRGSINLSMPDLKRIASHLGVVSTPLSQLEFKADIEGEDDAITTSAKVSVDQTSLIAEIDNSYEDQTISFSGSVQSENVHVPTILDLVSLFNEISTTPPEMDAPSAVQRIWLEDAIKPLMLDETFLAVDPEELIEAIFARFDIDLKKISGLPGLTRLQSVLEMEDGKLSLQPVVFSLPSGQAHFSLYLDAIDNPDTARAVGQVINISIKELLSLLEAPFDMAGTINGDFNLFANITSVDAVLSSLYGHANLSMGQGTVDTSLIKLAGLGVVPWLFSQDLWQGYSDINCIHAPLVIQPGRVFSNGFVLETNRVQVVAKGTADYEKNRIAIHAEPRKVAKPLARSFFPIEVYGALDAPKVRLLRDSKLSRPDSLTSNQSGEARQPCIMDKLQ